jgi:RecA-family ATPase
MYDVKEKVTAINPSAGTVGEQSQSQKPEPSLTDINAKINDDFDVDQARFYLQRVNSPDYLHTVSLTELYDTVYTSKTQIIEGLLCSGVYLCAGAPKVGKSFFMAQIGYHVSNGILLWDFPTNKGGVLYLALEDDYLRLQKRLSRMFGTDSTETCTSLLMPRI